MDLNRLSAQQQWLLLIVLATLLVSPYAIKRFWPHYQTIAINQKQLTTNQNTIKTPNYPDSPAEDEDDILADIDELQQSVDALNSQTDTLQSRIPPLESQDVLLELSAAARVNNITIVENVPYIVTQVRGSSTSNSNEAAPAAKLDREERRALRRSGTGASTATGQAVTGVIPREGELIYEVVNNLDESRPLQLMTLQGTYFGLMSFIESIRNLPVQVTILSLNIDTQVQIAAQNPQNMQGLPQLLRVSLIVAL
jgi:hypothetical protein